MIAGLGPVTLEAQKRLDALPREVRDEYVALRAIPNGLVCGVHRLLYHWTLHVDIHATGYEDRYCYATLAGATVALAAWNGQGDPEGWNRHPTTGRRRDPVTGREWVAW